MKEEIASLINKPPKPSAIDTVNKVRAYKKAIERIRKQLTKKLTETQLNSIYSEIMEFHK